MLTDTLPVRRKDQSTSAGLDVDASWSNKTAEVGAMRKMLDRTEDRFAARQSLSQRQSSKSNIVIRSFNFGLLRST